MLIPDWKRLLREFADYRPAEDPSRFEKEAFLRAMVRPPPTFVSFLLDGLREPLMEVEQGPVFLYLFLLDLRYDRKLNLLYFAFNVFEEDSPLPREIIDRTPFPHEDGYPPFRYCGDPKFEIPVRPRP